MEINMSVQAKRFQTVVVGNFQDKPMQNLITVDVPFPVNTQSLAKGARLFCAAPVKKVPQKQPLTWKRVIFTNKKKAEQTTKKVRKTEN